MVLDLLPTLDARTHTLCRVLHEHAHHQALPSHVVVPGRELELLLQNSSNDVWDVAVRPEGEGSHYEFVDHNAQGPDVHGETVAGGRDHLRRHVRGGSHHGVGHGQAAVQFLGQSEIYQLEVPMRVQHHVLGLEVPVHDLPTMESLECYHQRSSVELGLLSREDAHPPQLVVQHAARDQLCEDVHALWGVERPDNAQDERVLNALQEVHFVLQPLMDLPILLEHPLQGVPHFGPSVLHHAD
mmetsp:Transcript_15497/g.49627  ORF Transcript_15497/g.49627 Transcript_15497/m.49627 type:complete len:241 (-) Transcript_15497:727-1449(-)